jgi:hypothetical protein
MLRHLIKGLITALAIWLLNNYRKLSLDLVKIEAAGYYLKAIQMGRRGFLGALLLWLGIFIFAIGVVMLHAGFFVWLYLHTQNLRTVVIGLISLGAVYVVVALLAARYALSEEAWMKYFKADKMVADLTRK